MPPLASSRKLIFLHAPRTGGTTLQAALRGMYPGSFHFCRHSDPARVREAVNRHDCIELHVGDEQGQMVFLNQHVMHESEWPWLRECHLFVMFRRPEDQVLSNFQHLTSMRAQVEPYYRARNISFPATVREWLESPLARNLQLAFLLGNLPVVSGEVLERRHLDHAHRLLDTLDVTVGLTERYDDSLHILERVTGRSVPPETVEIVNRSRNRVDPPPADRAHIAEMNPLDVTLYADATRRFERLVAEHGPSTRIYCS